jgi:uncharacterized membrane protein
MNTGRLEAFSDGVIAIIITIMVLELKLPQGSDFAALWPLAPKLGSYALSFVFIGIYWNNHHHLFHIAEKVNGTILWANLHLLFWLSLIPFVTDWMGENHFRALPVALYGIVMIMAGIGYYILSHALAAHHGPDSKLSRALGRDYKGIASLVIYAVAILVAFFVPGISVALYVVVALMWFIPDRRVERVLE